MIMLDPNNWTEFDCPLQEQTQRAQCLSTCQRLCMTSAAGPMSLWVQSLKTHTSPAVQVSISQSSISRTFSYRSGGIDAAQNTAFSANLPISSSGWAFGGVSPWHAASTLGLCCSRQRRFPRQRRPLPFLYKESLQLRSETQSR